MNVSDGATEQQERRANLVPCALHTRVLPERFTILGQTGELLAPECGADFFCVADLQDCLQVEQERRNRRICHGEGTTEGQRPVCGQQGLDRLKTRQDGSHGWAFSVQMRHIRLRELGVDDVDEEPSLSAPDRVGGKKTRVRVEVGHELHEDTIVYSEGVRGPISALDLHGLPKFCALGRRLVQRDIGSAVGHGRRLTCGVDVLGVPLRPRLDCEVDLVLLVVGLGLGEGDIHLS
jgi:hypothetical protein